MTVVSVKPSESAMGTGDLQRFTENNKRSPEKRDDLAKRFADEIEKLRSAVSNENRSSSSPFVHSQVLKIREEDSHLGEDIGEGLSKKDKLEFLHLSSQMDAFFYSRRILPSSPLGHNTAIYSEKGSY